MCMREQLGEVRAHICGSGGWDLPRALSHSKGMNVPVHPEPNSSLKAAVHQADVLKTIPFLPYCDVLAF